MPERVTVEDCPLCASTERTAWLHALGFELVRCRACGHRYSTSVLSSEVLANDYYDEPDDDLFARGMAAKLQRFEEYLALLGPAPWTPGSRVLDVGCNGGELLSLFQQQGWSPFGIEMSPGPARLAERRLGVPIWQGLVEEQLPPNRQFDLITLSHVLEHIHRPRELLLRLMAALAPGGKLLIEVPNADDVLLRVWGGGYRPLCPGDHLSFFDAPRLRRTLEEVGLSVPHLVSPLHARDMLYPSLLSAVDRTRAALRRDHPAAPAGVCAQTRYRGRLRRPLRAAMDRLVDALDPAIFGLTRGWQQQLRGAVLIAVADRAHP